MKKLSLYIFLVLMLCNTVQALPKCESDILVEWTNCQGTWVLPDNEKYLGEFKDGKFHGQGTYTWSNGSRYIGEFKDSKMHGQGSYTWADGTVEKGIWKNDKLIELN